MNILLRVLHFCIGGCPHRHTYRERRKLHGADVLHLVCEDCGHAVPAIQRTAREHRQAVKAGAVHIPKVQQDQGEVVAFQSRKRRRQSA